MDERGLLRDQEDDPGSDLGRGADTVERSGTGQVVEAQCSGGCPLGSLASDLSESDPVARVQLENAFARWEELIRDGLVRMQKRGELAESADPGDLAVAMLAAVQGGLLLSQVRRDPAPLRTAVDTMIAHLHSLTN